MVMTTSGKPAKTPPIEIVRWKVFRVPSKGNKDFVVGYVSEKQTSMVFGPISEYTLKTKTAIVGSKPYQLVGDSGFDEKGCWEWAMWRTVNGVIENDDVTVEYE